MVEGGNSPLYKIKESMQYEVDIYKNKFKCIDKQHLEIWGDYDSREAQQLQFEFVFCQGGTDNGCETEENIREWLKRKFIVLLYNEIRFDTEKFFYESRVYESRIIYIPISSQIKQVIPFKIQRTHLELQDYQHVMLGEITEIEMDNLFRLEKKQPMPYEFNDGVWISVTIEMSLDLFKYDRQMYTIFDMLSDIGGLSGIMITFTSIFLKVWNRH